VSSQTVQNAMKPRLIVFLSILGILCFQMSIAQGIMRTDSLDSVLRMITNPKVKVDSILKYLEKPENQYLDNTTELANRALEIAQQNNYASGKIMAMIELGNSYLRSSDY